jgi:hypothetical protein
MSSVVLFAQANGSVEHALCAVKCQGTSLLVPLLAPVVLALAAAHSVAAEAFCSSGFPQGLKPVFYGVPGGTTEVVS